MKRKNDRASHAKNKSELHYNDIYVIPERSYRESRFIRKLFNNALDSGFNHAGMTAKCKWLLAFGACF
jgi:hypothetical protein